MPPKKAAKKAAAKKSAAKKSAGHHDPHKAAKDARRTFEHLGRVQAISRLVTDEEDALHLLTQTADAAFRARQYKDSADLLRTAEHLSFALIHRSEAEAVSHELRETIDEEVQHLLQRAEEHASHDAISQTLPKLLERMTGEAQAAVRRGSYRAALEYARGAEALAHVHQTSELTLPSATSRTKLQA